MLPVGAIGKERDGMVQVSVELGPICSTKFQSSRPGEQAIALSKTISRVLSDIIDPKDLRISDDLVWDISVSVICTSYDGNVLDAALFAAVVCLMDTQIPDVVLSSKGELAETNNPSKKLALQRIPIPLTLAVFERDGQTLDLIDPTALEEDCSHSFLTVVVVVKNDGAGSAAHVDAAAIVVHKAGGAALSPAFLSRAIKRARSRARDVLGLMREDMSS
jgi:exosome complex RNA-binding protein Rrp42 (RNase PH superfamily)